MASSKNMDNGQAAVDCEINKCLFTSVPRGDSTGGPMRSSSTASLQHALHCLTLATLAHRAAHEEHSKWFKLVLSCGRAADMLWLVMVYAGYWEVLHLMGLHLPASTSWAPPYMIAASICK